MNDDFSELESKLKALRPTPLREEFIAQVERAMAKLAPKAPSVADPKEDKIVRPIQFQTRWAIGLGLAAAAAVLLLVRVNFQTPASSNDVASLTSPEPSVGPVRVRDNAVQNSFVPAGRTQVVYRKRDEGLLFADNSEQPMRRFRSTTQETVQWHNPATGASLRVTYPSEQVELVPIYGQ
jgi:hypothetical protein